MNQRLLYLWLLVPLVWPARLPAQLRVDNAVLRLGEIRGGTPLPCSFTLSNGSKQPIEILEISRGCGCLVPTLPERILAPGMTTKLRFDLRTLGHKEGVHAWHARIHYREGTTAHEIPLQIEATIKNEVAVEPAALALFLESNLRQEILLSDRRPRPLLVTKVECTHSAVQTRAEAGPRGQWKIVVEANAAALAPGRHDEMLNIYTNDPLYAHLQVPVTLVRAQRSAVLITPEVARIQLTPQEPMPSVLVRLRPRNSDSLVIQRAVCADPAVTCTWANDPARGGVVKIQVDARRWSGTNTTVEVHLEKPAATLRIPVEVTK